MGIDPGFLELLRKVLFIVAAFGNRKPSLRSIKINSWEKFVENIQEFG